MVDKKLKQIILGQKSCFVLIPWEDFNLMITNVEINATKIVSINQLVQQIINLG